MEKTLKKEIEDLRLEKLGLNTIDTQKVFDTIISAYKNNIVKEERDILCYAVDIALCNMNGFNKLGAIENLYEKWGDLFFVDLNNSTFMREYVNEDGSMEVDEGIEFKDVEELSVLKDIRFSLKEMINLCQEKGINIKLFGKDKDDEETALEMNFYNKKTTMDENVKIYLESVK